MKNTLRRDQLTPLNNKLLNKQKSICPVCNNTLRYNEEDLEVHHILPKVKGGLNTIKNLMLLHKTCHKSVTNCKDPKLKVEYILKGINKIPKDNI